MKPICQGCGKSPDQIPEYIELGQEEDMTPDQYVRQEEGTYNRLNGHFLCTSCYFDRGMPSSSKGWVCP